MLHQRFFLIFGLLIGFGFVDRLTAETQDQPTDPDFEIQGEYVSENQAMQVVAAGDGEFDLVIWQGGLPGAGARPEPPRRIEGDADLVDELVESMQLKRVVRRSPTLGQKPPADAIVLFDGTEQSVQEHWQKGKLDEDNLLQQGTTSKQTFQDYTLHLEFRTPWMPKARGQGRGNSGVYHQGRYETQILDSFGTPGANNETGGVYEHHDPTENLCFPPMSWQTYDVDFTAARFNNQGKKTADARMTVKLNGVVVQSNVAVPSSTRASKLKEGPAPGPIYLQDHGNPVRFRNIWIVPRDAEREARRPVVPGYERFFANTADPKSLVHGGQLLISSLACSACHASPVPSVLPEKSGPDLSQVGTRVRHDALVAMIANPHQTKPGTAMPDPWPGATDEVRQRNASAIASFLLYQSQTDSPAKPTDRIVSSELARRGDKLFHEIGCVACHASEHGQATPTETTVPLGELAQKYTAVSLAEFLMNPHAVRPGQRMPRLVTDNEEAIAIAAYLTRQVTVGEVEGRFKRTIYRGGWDKLPDFSKLEAGETDEVKTLKLDDIQPNNNYGVVFESQLFVPNTATYRFDVSSDDGAALYIADKSVVNDGIHPVTKVSGEIELEAGVHPYRIEFFQAGGGAELYVDVTEPGMGKQPIAAMPRDASQAGGVDLLPSKFVPDRSQIATGQKLFNESGCAQCHQTQSDLPKREYVSFVDASWERGCLAKEVKSPAIDFELGAKQQAALIAAIQSIQSKTQTNDSSVDDLTRVHMTMSGLNCYACHERNKQGGPEPQRDEWFQTTTPEMGLEGRLPPPLDGVGDKLKDAYLAKLLEQGADERSYIRTRMPAYGHESLKSFVRSVVALDRRDEMQSASQNQAEELVIASGRQLCGNAGLACIKCHSFGGEKGGGIGAIDMLKMPERLRPEWFQRYLQDPIAYRPGTRMPNSFVDGKSAITDVYDGDPVRQIDAIWTYLKQGDQAKVPEGLIPGVIALAAEKRARIYRNFFKDVSPRGIGVAYTDRVNVIWDAEHMSLAKAWRNSFIDASMHWRGRGQGSQSPLGDAVVNLEPVVPIAQLDALDSPWPERSARERGYRFRGYRLNAAGEPTFSYQFDQTLIHDHVHDESIPLGLSRQIEIENAKENLVLQLASGNIVATEDGYRVNDTFTIRIDGIEPSIVVSGNQSNLRAALPAHANSTIHVKYQW